MITYTRQVPVLAEPDVLVCGAGCAGIGAALGAARERRHHHGGRPLPASPAAS